MTEKAKPDPIVNAVKAKPDPVVSAVLADPVVQAVLEAASAAAPDAVTPATSEAPTPTPTPTPTPAPAPAPVAPGEAPLLQPGQVGGKSPDKPHVMITPSGKVVAAPTTTEEDDRATVGQRRINLLWEVTQSVVAVTITVSTLYVAGNLALKENGDTAAFLLLSNVFFLVLGTYFNRTNHVKVGGVGKNDGGR